MGRPKVESRIREFFSINNELKSSRCLICEKITAGNHLGNLKKHLKRHHENVLNDIEKGKPPVRKPKRMKKKITVEYDVQDLIDNWLNLIIKEGRPFALLNSKALRNIVKPIFDALNEKLLSSYDVAAAIHERAEKMRDEIRDLLANRIISIKIDGASRHLRRVLCVNSQVIIDNKIVVRTLAMKEINRRHTAQNIKDFIKSTLGRYNMKLEQVYSATQDNGKNMIAAANLLEYFSDTNQQGEQMDIESNENELVFENEEIPEDENTDNDSDEDSTFLDDVDGVKVVRCAAHTAELGAKDTLNKLNIKRIVAKFRALANHLRTPTNVDLLRSEGLRIPKTDSKPRWHTSYDMALSLKLLKDFCETNGINILSNNDWLIMDVFLKVFKPVKIAIKKLQDEQLTLGDFFKVWLDLMLRIQKMSESEETKVFAQELYRNLMQREALLFEENKALQAALYLDPRFRRIMVQIRPDYFDINQAQQELLSLYKHMKKLEKEAAAAEKAQSDLDLRAVLELQEGDEIEESQSAQAPAVEASHSPEGTSLLFERRTSHRSDLDDTTLQDYIDRLVDDHMVNPETEEKDEDEDIISAFAAICNYNDQQPLNTNVLEYWYDKRYSSPILYKLAKIVHGVPATQVTVERSFSGLRYILSDYRTSMKADVLEDLMLLYINLNH